MNYNEGLLEVWVSVPGYEGLYEVSSYGRVMAIFTNWNGRHKPGRILKPINHTQGYLCVNLYRPGTDKRPKMRTIHSLVLEGFKGPRPPGADTRHLDRCKTRNTVDNLEWGSRSENVHDSIRHGTFVHGENSNLSILDEKQATSIRKLWEDGESAVSIAKQFNISKEQAWRIGTRRSWKYLK